VGFQSLKEGCVLTGFVNDVGKLKGRDVKFISPTCEERCLHLIFGEPDSNKLVFGVGLVFRFDQSAALFHSLSDLL
jgi:hypothetical protein